MNRRFVIIGCGRIAHRHAKEIRKCGELAGVCDTDPEKLGQFTETYQVPGFEDAAAMLADTDASVAVICSPNYLHIPHSLLALRHGLHVLCEKPLCLHPDDATPLAAALVPGGPRFFIVLSARFHSSVRLLKQYIEEGRLGDICSFQLNACWNRNESYFNQSKWKGRKCMDGGILYTQFSHYIDVLTWCLGDLHPVAVTRKNYLHHKSIEGEDTGTALLESATGSIGSMHWTVNSTGQNMEVGLLVVGKAGTIRLGGTYMDELEYVKLAEEPAFDAVKQADTFSQVTPRSHHDLVYRDLLADLEDGGNRVTGLQEGLRSIELIRNIYAFPQSSVTKA